MFHKIGLIILCFGFSSLSYSQSATKFNKKWLLGVSVVFTSDFNVTPVKNSYFDTTVGYIYYGGHSNLCDSFGNLLLVSDGMNLRGGTGTLIDNGDTLVPDKIYIAENGASGWAQASIILPLSNNKYIFIANSFSDYHFDNVVAPWNDVLVYSIVDMNANAGAGKVVRKRVTLLDNVQFSREQMTAVRHGNGEDWWLVKQGWDSNVIYKFHIKQDTILGPFVQRYAEPYYGPNPLGGQSAFSRSGNRYASTRREAGKVFVGNFNRCTGNYSNPMVYNVPVLSAHNPSAPSEMDGATES